MLQQYNELHNIEYKIQVIQCNECQLQRCLSGKCSIRGGGARPKIPPPHTEKETHHTKKMASTWREKTARIEKVTPLGKSPQWNFFIHALPGQTPTFAPPPFASADHDLHSLFSVCLRQLEKNTKSKQKHIFWLFCCIKYSCRHEIFPEFRNFSNLGGMGSRRNFRRGSEPKKGSPQDKKGPPPKKIVLAPFSEACSPEKMLTVVLPTTF